MLRTFSTPEELTEFLSTYEKRRMDDRERIEMMMRYAETTGCRMQFLRAYFGGDRGVVCDHCDNCRARAEDGSPIPKSWPTARKSKPSRSIASRHVTEMRLPIFRVGDLVTHARFGPGTVVEILGENLMVEFENSVQKRIRSSYLRAAS